VEHLLSRGHRRVAYVGGDPAVGTGASRLGGYRQALRNAGHSYDPGLVSLGNHTVEAAWAAATSLLSGPAAADAVFADNNRMCLGVLHAVDRHGTDIGVAGFDDLELVDLLPTQVALVTYDAVELGRHAAELLFNRIGGDTGPFRRAVHPTSIVLRGGDRKVSAPS
jgi:LacI family transcriptional regulator